MSVQTYVVIRDGKIVGGPYQWNGMTEWSPPEEGMLVLESEAKDMGITKKVQEKGTTPDETRKKSTRTDGKG